MLRMGSTWCKDYVKSDTQKREAVSIHSNDLTQEIQLLTNTSCGHISNACEWQSKIEKFLAILKKHEVSYNKYHHVINQIIFILKQHDCHIMSKNVATGKAFSINDEKAIQHSLCIESTGIKCHITGSKHHTWLKRKTRIYIKGEPKSEGSSLTQSLVGKRTILHRHVVYMPVCQMIFQKYHLVVPSCILHEIWTFVCTNIDSFGNTVDELYYPNFEDTFHSTQNGPSTTWEIGDTYINSDSGDIGFTIKTSTGEGRMKLFNDYYKEIIQAFNLKVKHFIKNNQFFKITVKKNTQIETDDIEIDFKIRYQRAVGKEAYQFCAYLSGFNNLNMNKATNTDDNDRCIIESNWFCVRWQCQSSRQSYEQPSFDDFFGTPMHKFEQACDFLTANDDAFAIMPRKFYHFLEVPASGTDIKVALSEQYRSYYVTPKKVREGHVKFKWWFESYDANIKDATIF